MSSVGKLESDMTRKSYGMRPFSTPFYCQMRGLYNLSFPTILPPSMTDHSRFCATSAVLFTPKFKDAIRYGHRSFI
jgi:hypothetical protein